jgi:hypothetical protein
MNRFLEKRADRSFPKKRARPNMTFSNASTYTSKMSASIFWGIHLGSSIISRAPRGLTVGEGTLAAARAVVKFGGAERLMYSHLCIWHYWDAV